MPIFEVKLTIDKFPAKYPLDMMTKTYVVKAQSRKRLEDYCTKLGFIIEYIHEPNMFYKQIRKDHGYLFQKDRDIATK